MLEKLDNRWVYALLIVVTVVPTLWPVPLPIRITPHHQTIYEFVESLEPKDVVVISAEYTAGSIGDAEPPLVAMTKHAIQKDLRVVFVALSPDGLVAAEKMVDLCLVAGKVYGEDVVGLGYAAGGEQAIASMVGSFAQTFPLDARGNPIESLPLMSEVKSPKDVKIVLQDTDGDLGPLGWIRQSGIPHKTPIATVVSPIMAPAAMPYYQAGQVIGVGSGLRFAAEYESLINAPGRGTAGMTAQSFSHAYFILLVILGNIGYFTSKKAPAKGGSN